MDKGLAPTFAVTRSLHGFTYPVEAFSFLHSFQKKGGDERRSLVKTWRSVYSLNSVTFVI